MELEPMVPIAKWIGLPLAVLLAFGVTYTVVEQVRRGAPGCQPPVTCPMDPLAAGGVLTIRSPENGQTFDVQVHEDVILSIWDSHRPASAISSNPRVLKKIIGPRGGVGDMRVMFEAVGPGSAWLDLTTWECPVDCSVSVLINVVAPEASPTGG
ncbi:MAG: hypothetical protein ACHQ0J_06620 [Candidatus Dormibacterales bacterium]